MIQVRLILQEAVILFEISNTTPAELSVDVFSDVVPKEVISHEVEVFRAIVV